MIKDISSLKDAELQMTAFMNPVVHESDIPLQVLYNQKIERIRVLEYERHSAPLPIMFDISECYDGMPSKRRIKIQSESAPKVYHFEVDLEDKTGPRIYET